MSLTVYWQLRLDGITITNETYCGYEEHVHTDDCYEYTLICELEESEGHAHTDECYEEQQVLICELEESEEHTHTEACYETQKVLICELEESDGHTHTDECYEKTLVCELEEHTHTTDCLVDLKADVEDATVWEATLPELTGDLRTDIVNIAYSQIGYTESTANYTLAEDGITHMGYTRYGAWYGGLYYGSEYSDWDSMFVAFCLDYAGIAEEFTYSAGAYAWSVDLSSLGYYQTADSYAPSTGDVAFIDTDADGRANVTAVVVSVDETAQTITVIQGNYTVTDSEGDSTDTVALVTYSTATETVTQNEIIALSAGSETEITPVVLGYANVTYVNVTYVNATDVAEAGEEVIAEETDSEELAEEVAEEVTVDETETEEAEETEETEEETVLLTATASTDYVTQVTELYDYAMTLTAGDTSTAATVWNALMSVWEQIYAEEDAGTLTLTAEEYDNIDALTDEVYYYFVETVGYDPHGIMTVEETQTSTTVTIDGTSYPNLVYYATTSMSENGTSYYDSDSDAIYVPLILNFSSLTVGGSYPTTYAVALPEGVVPNVDLNTAIDAKDSSPDFTMTFVKGDDGIYYVIITFDVTEETSVTTGYVSFEAVYANSSTDVPITITYTDETEFTIEITSEDIESDGNATYDADVNVKKTSASYDFTTNSVTYTVTVSSTKGTGGDITLTDLLAATGLTTKDVSIVSVTLNGEDVTGNSTYYTATLTSAESFTVTLKELGAGGIYVITYTIYFDNESTEISATLTNIANAEVEDKDIEAEVTNTKYVNTSVVSKSGTYSNGTITWTITVNPYNADIAGYTFTDDAFADAYTNNTLQVSGDSSDWEYVKDSDDKVTGIKFLGTTTDGDSDATNTNTYTITCTQTVGSSTLGTSKTYSNTVSVTDDEEEKVTDKTATVTVKDNDLIGDLTKSVSAGTATNGTRILTWTSIFTVPEGGIAADTVIYDYLGTGSGDVWNYVNAGTTHQWFTYAQIIALFAGDISIGGKTVDADAYTFSAYDATIGAWVDYDTLKDDATYGKHIFTAYKITFITDVEIPGTMTLTYSTTADISSVTTERTYWNNITTGSLSAAASYTEYINVYKTGGKGSTADSTRETTDGTVTWKVYVYVAEGTTGDITIVDTLPTTPSTINFVSATVTCGSTTLDVTPSVSGQDVTITIPYSTYGSYITSPGSYIIVTYTCEIADFDDEVDALLKAIASGSTTTTIAWDSFTNSATVTIGDGTPETVTQTQKVTYEYTAEKNDEVIKDYTYDSINNYLNYYVVVNLGADDLAKGSDTLDFEDVLRAAYDYGGYTWGAIVELITSSVNFYELIELSGDSSSGYYYTVGTTTVNLTDYTDSDLYESGGKVYYKSLLDIAWTYDETYEQSTDSKWVAVYHTISATIPDSTAIYVEYSYSWEWLYQQSGISTPGDLTNTVSISGETKVSKRVQETYVESKVTGTASSGNVFTLTKVDSTSMTTTLSGAEFTIYKYVDGTNDTSTGVTLTTDENGTLTVTSSTYDFEKNTLYYLVESEAPDGYSTDTSTKYYFYWTDDGKDANDKVTDQDANDAYTALNETLASILGTAYTVDLSTYSGSTYAKNTASTASTTLTITKVSSEHSTTRLAGATYTLQEYDSTSSTWVDVKDDSGAAVTFTTNSLGQFTVSAEDLTGLTYNQAYCLVETTYPTGYYAADSGEDVIYFWWSASDTTSNPEVAPSGWSASHSNDGSSISTAIDLGSSSKDLTVTNTPIPTTEVTVNKKWVDDSGVTTDAPSGATATVDLYYYLGEKIQIATTTDLGETVTLYFGGDAQTDIYSMATSTLASNVASASYLSTDIPINQAVTVTVTFADGTTSYTGDYAYEYLYYDNNGYGYCGNITIGATSGTNTKTYTIPAYTGSDTLLLYQITGGSLSNIESITLSYTDSEGTTFTKTYSDGSWSLWTESTTSGGTGTGTVTSGSTIYFGANGIYGGEKSITVPSGTDVTIIVSNTSDYTWSWYGIYVYPENAWTSDNSLNTDYSPNSSTFTASFTASYLYYLINHTLVDGETVAVTYDGVTYSSTYTSGSWSTWTTTGGTGTGGSTDGYSASELRDYTKDTLVGTYTLYNGNWSETISNLPQYVITTDDSGTYIQYYYYYFVETDAKGADYTAAVYSTADGVNEGEITITNTVDETYTSSVELPSTGGAGTTTMYEFGIMLILLSLVGAGAYRNISRIRKSLVEEPLREGVDPGGTHERLPDVRNRKFVIPRTARKGDTRAGPDG
ncbi:MAG: prealbumin-like fold domain-containing protein [Ruminococcus sp.]|nr:prealbumin-like fold domain-containing protein [Ruminococcus sp.]